MLKSKTVLKELFLALFFWLSQSMHNCVPKGLAICSLNQEYRTAEY